MSAATAILSPAELAFLNEARRATLATISPDGRARLVPITYACDADQAVIYFALDEKPKSVDDPRQLARVRDILARPGVTLLVDRWSEDWTRLAWLRLEGEASLLEPHDHAEEHAAALHMLRERYVQYADHRLEERPIVRIDIQRAVGWNL
jgi:coenzyme F420-0:L-glutamate ligase / coenzyme F420-1:gamma-L-glutamate ligase